MSGDGMQKDKKYEKDELIELELFAIDDENTVENAELPAEVYFAEQVKEDTVDSVISEDYYRENDDLTEATSTVTANYFLEPAEKQPLEALDESMLFNEADLPKANLPKPADIINDDNVQAERDSEVGQVDVAVEEKTILPTSEIDYDLVVDRVYDLLISRLQAELNGSGTVTE